MSYILDALRKSERDRQAGAAQSVVEMPVDSAEQTTGKPWLAILISVLICINLVTLLVVFLYNRETSAPTVTTVGQPEKPNAKPTTPDRSDAVPNNTEQVAVEVSPPATAPEPIIQPAPTRKRQTQASQPVVHPVKNTTASNRTAEPRTQIQRKSDNTENRIVHRTQNHPSEPAAIKVPPTLQREQPNVTVPDRNMSKNAKPSKPQLVDSNAIPPIKTTKTKPMLQTADTKTSQIPTAVKPKKPRLHKPTQKEINTAKASPPIAKTKLTSAPSTPTRLPQPVSPKQQEPEPSIPFLRDLPRDFQRQVPNLNINVFVYSDNVDERFVIINMVKYKNGQQLREGPTVEDIRPDSIVLQYRDRDFRVNRP